MRFASERVCAEGRESLGRNGAGTPQLGAGSHAERGVTLSGVCGMNEQWTSGVAHRGTKFFVGA